MIEPENFGNDQLTSIKYEGDFGIVSGVGTTSVVGVATTGLTFDLFIPLDSPLRSSSTMSTPITSSGIKTGYYCCNNSNTGAGVTSVSGNTTVGIGTSFIDNIYKVAAVENITGNAYGFGTTTLTRVTVSVMSTEGVGLGNSEFFGRYSWGRLHDFVKEGTTAFNVINTDGVVGIQTGPIIVRTRDLKERTHLTINKQKA